MGLQTLLLTTLRPKRFQGLQFCTSSGVLSKGSASLDAALSLAHRLVDLRLEEASASDPRDKEMIDQRVQRMPGGFGAVNAFMRSKIRQALLASKTSFEDDIAKVLDALGTEET